MQQSLPNILSTIPPPKNVRLNKTNIINFGDKITVSWDKVVLSDGSNAKYNLIIEICYMPRREVYRKLIRNINGTSFTHDTGKENIKIADRTLITYKLYTITASGESRDFSRSPTVYVNRYQDSPMVVTSKSTISLNETITVSWNNVSFPGITGIKYAVYLNAVNILTGSSNSKLFETTDKSFKYQLSDKYLINIRFYIQCINAATNKIIETYYSNILDIPSSKFRASRYFTINDDKLYYMAGDIVTLYWEQTSINNQHQSYSVNEFKRVPNLPYTRFNVPNGAYKYNITIPDVHEVDYNLNVYSPLSYASSAQCIKFDVIDRTVKVGVPKIWIEAGDRFISRHMKYKIFWDKFNHDSSVVYDVFVDMYNIYDNYDGFERKIIVTNHTSTQFDLSSVNITTRTLYKYRFGIKCYDNSRKLLALSYSRYYEIFDNNEPPQTPGNIVADINLSI